MVAIFPRCYWLDLSLARTMPYRATVLPAPSLVAPPYNLRLANFPNPHLTGHLVSTALPSYLLVSLSRSLALSVRHRFSLARLSVAHS